MTLAWTLSDVGRVLEVAVDDASASASVARVSTDSRSVAAGDLFVAVHGERFDGHDFVDDALESGAVAAVVDDRSDGPRRLRVDDTLAALRSLAAQRRSELDVPVLAITGSTGKTTTKDLLAAALEGSVASQRSFNNEVGVPLTVLGVPDDARYVVAEVGSRGVGHIEWLMPAVQPDVSVVTNLGVVHLETFGSEANLAQAKFELVAALQSEGTAVLPADEPRLLERNHAGSTVTFGVDVDADVVAFDIRLDEMGRPTFQLDTSAGTVDVSLPLAGRHQAANAAAAVAAGMAVGADPQDMATRMADTHGSAWRLEIHQGSFTVVNDAYNANPQSVEAALRTVAAVADRPIAFLGLMAELGPLEATEHERMGRLARELGFRKLVIVGRDPGYAAGAGGIALAVADRDEALERARELVDDGDTVLVKASRSVGLEALAASLISRAEGARL